MWLGLNCIFLLPVLIEQECEQSECYPELCGINDVEVAEADWHPVNESLFGAKADLHITDEPNNSGHLQVDKNNVHAMNLWLKQSLNHLESPLRVLLKLLESVGFR